MITGRPVKSRSRSLFGRNGIKRPVVRFYLNTKLLTSSGAGTDARHPLHVAYRLILALFHAVKILLITLEGAIHISFF